MPQEPISMTQQLVSEKMVHDAANEAKLEFQNLVLEASKKVSQLINQERVNGGIFSGQSKDQLEAALKVLEIAYKGN